MKRSLYSSAIMPPAWIRITFLCLLLLGALETSATENSRMARSQFKQPDRSYATAPLWVWNDDLNEQQVRQTLGDLASQEVRQAFVHPRPGLMTPYLSRDWFRLWRIALDEAEKLGMNLWIYDENSYPSGFAGGWVPENMPVARGRGLQLRAASGVPAWTDATMAVFRRHGDRFENVTTDVRNGVSLPQAQYLTATLIRAANSPWHGNRSYVDLLYPGVTEQFLEITIEAYRREFGPLFGSRIPGIFADEPHILPAGGLPWTDDLPEVFERRWGYGLLDHLPELTQEVGDWRRVRHNYFQVLLDLFIDRWAEPYYNRCEQYGLEFTGHYWEHEWPNCLVVPDNMAMSAWQQRPAIDTLMNRYEEQTHAQFGNIRSVREISSLANQLGRKRTLCEVYGAGGWDLRFEDMKRIGDWLAVLGINTFDEHLSYISLRGARKRDHPQSFSYHEPWWDMYHVIERYLTRLSLALSQGEQVNRILVLEPTTTAWMYQGDAHASTQLDAVGDQFFQFLVALERHQIEYDIGCEDVLARYGSVQGNLLHIGERNYECVVLPPMTENLNSPTFKLLERFLRGKGAVIGFDPGPSRADGASSDAVRGLSNAPGWQILQSDAALDALSKVSHQAPLVVTRTPADRGILFHHRREFADGQMLFLVNTSIAEPTTGTIRAVAGGIERWDLLSGDIDEYSWTSTEVGVESSFELPPSGSLLLFFPKERQRSPHDGKRRPGRSLPASGAMQVQRLGPNVLTLDYVSITAGDESLTNAYFYAANQFAFRKNGMDRNPWDSAVQFRDELIARTFPADSGFRATYRFTIAESVPSDLEAVVERPNLYTITCNGHPVTAIPGRWWLDRAFGRISLSRFARRGVNELVLKAAPFRIEHELEPVYLLGSFALRATDHGFTIEPDAPLTFREIDASTVSPRRSGWNAQGHPFYAEGVTYRQSFNISKKREGYRVALGDWYGSVAKVFVNQKPVGSIFAPPWECDISRHIHRGENTVEVVVIGTLKNTLGPHHGDPGVGSAWPGMFQNGPEHGPPPGAQYHTLAYGLFEPFTLIESNGGK